MGQVKQIERNLIINAAGHYLSDQEEGDLYDAYEKLQTASEEGQGDKCASDFVVVWQPLEYKTVDEILDLIEGSKTTYEDENNPINKIDFTELRNQKTTLLETIRFLEESGIMSEFDPNVDTVEIVNNLTGILHLIDSLQDYAVDELGWDQMLVFDFEKEDERED